MKIDNKKFDLAMANGCFTADKIADMTGIAPATIARIKRGSQSPRPATIGKIAKALNVKVEDLIEE